LVRRQTIEFYLILAVLSFAFFYFPLRGIVWDFWIWIAIAPGVCFLYVAALGTRFLNYRLNALDKIFLLYLIYGVVITITGVQFLGFSRSLGFAGLIHFYWPSILYFLARNYTRISDRNVLNIIKVFWILAIVLIVDLSVEYYVVKVRDTPMAIPWTRVRFEKYGELSADEQEALKVDAVHSILGGRRRTGLVAVAMFSFILPFFYLRHRKRRSTETDRSFPFNSALSIAMMTILIFFAFNQNNKTAILTSISVIGVHLLLRSSRRLYLYLAAVVAFILLFQYDFISETVRYNLTGTADGGPTNLERTLAFGTVVRGYLDADIFSYAFGNYILGSNAVLKIGAAPFGGELRGLTMPLSFGFGWAIIIGAGLITTARYAYGLIKTRSTESRFFEVFGLAFLGLLIVYAGDIHYPKWNTHGALELYMVAAGTLSSLWEASRRNVGRDEEMVVLQELRSPTPT
jgi:hypothetical protein